MLYLKRSTGNDVKLVQLWNVAWNAVLETAVLYLKRSTGNDVKLVQLWNVEMKLASPGIVGTMDVAFSRARSAALLPNLIFPPEAKLPVILGYQRPAVAYVCVLSPVVV